MAEEDAITATCRGTLPGIAPKEVEKGNGFLLVEKPDGKVEELMAERADGKMEELMEDIRVKEKGQRMDVTYVAGNIISRIARKEEERDTRPKGKGKVRED